MSVLLSAANTPRNRNPNGRFAVPDRVANLNVQGVLPVKYEFFQDFLGLERFTPRKDESLNEELRRSIYFTHLPEEVSNLLIY